MKPRPLRLPPLRPDERRTFRLEAGCGVRRAPPSPPWTFSHSGYVEADDPVTGVNPSGAAMFFLLQVREVPHRGDTPPKVTVWVRGARNPNNLEWEPTRERRR